MAIYRLCLLLLLLPPSHPFSTQTAPLNRKQRRAHLQPPGTPAPPPAQPATALTPATLNGIVEDHSVEQYFFDAPTCEALLEMLRPYERPLLLCAPAVAVAAEKAGGSKCLLLDRDERFSFLPGFRKFDLDNCDPAAARFDGGEAADVVLCDPPFANFPLAKLRAVVDELAPGATLFLAYNQKREEEVLEAFKPRQLQALSGLGYLSVKPNTQANIVLFGPPGTKLPVVRPRASSIRMSARKQVSRREVLDGSSLTKQFYDPEGWRKNLPPGWSPALVVLLGAIGSNYGSSVRAQLFDELRALGEGATNQGKVSHVPIVAMSPGRKSGQVSVEITAPVSAPDAIDYIWMYDETGEIISGRKFSASQTRFSLAVNVDKGRKIVPAVHVTGSDAGTWVGEAVVVN